MAIRLIRQRHPLGLPETLALRFAQTSMVAIEVLLEGITDLAGMGEISGHNLYEAELRYLD